MNKKELIKFWKSSASRSGSRNILKDSSALHDITFLHNLAHLSGKADRIFMKISSQMYLSTRKF